MDSIECIDAKSGLSKLEDKSIDFILIDPPYLISNNRDNNNFKEENGGGGDQYRFGNLDLVIADWDKEGLDFSIFPEFSRVLKTTGSLMCFYDVWKMQELRTSLEEIGFRQFRLLEWIKSNPVPVNSKHNYLSNAKEYFLYCVKRGKATFNSEYDNGTYHCSLCHGKERTKHPTQKPLSLIKELIVKHTNESDVVLDCFMGSGTTAVACKELNRKFIGFEINKEYCDMAKARLNNIYINHDQVG